MHDTIAFLGEANLAGNQHLVVFQGNVEKCNADHQRKVNNLEKKREEDQEWVARLEEQLANVREEIRKVAVVNPLPQTLMKPFFLQRTTCPPIIPHFPHPSGTPAPVTNQMLGLRSLRRHTAMAAGGTGGGPPPHHL